MMCGYRNGIPIPKFDGYNPSDTNNCGTHRALRDDFIDWIRSLEPVELAERAISFSNGHELALTEHLFRVAVANTNSNFRELQDAAEYIENRMHGFWRFKGYDIDEEAAANCIQMLRYFIMDNMRLTESTISLLKGRFSGSSEGKPGIPSLARASSDSKPQISPLAITLPLTLHA